MDPVGADERELWTRSLTHDSRAFAEIFDLHHERVFRHLLRQVESRADADEVTASAFLELWRLRTRVRLVDGSVLPWLLVTASNLARNSVRARVRYRAVLDRLPHPSASVDPAAAVADRIGGGHGLVGALGRLSGVDRALITMTVLEGLSTAEAAAALGLSPTAARARLSRARRRIGADLRGPRDDDPARLMPEGGAR